MVRDEEFGEVPNLGPARDAMDQAPARAAARPRPIPEAPKKATVDPASVRSGGNGFVYLLLLLLVFSSAGFGYWSYQRQLQLEELLVMLGQQQQVSGQKIAALEGLISTTDENASKSGAALQAQLRKLLSESESRIAHVDSELAKLWTVSYQRNRPQLEALEKTVAGVSQQLAGIDKQFKASDQTVAGLRNDLAKSDKVLAHTGEALNALTSTQAQMQDAAQRIVEQLRIRDQANQELDELQDGQLKRLAQQLTDLQQNPQAPAALRELVAEQGRTIDSINAFRKQINQEVLRLRDRINALQLSVPQKPAS